MDMKNNELLNLTTRFGNVLTTIVDVPKQRVLWYLKNSTSKDVLILSNDYDGNQVKTIAPEQSRVYPTYLAARYMYIMYGSQRRKMRDEWNEIVYSKFMTDHSPLMIFDNSNAYTCK